MDSKTREGLEDAIAAALRECESCCLDSEEDVSTVQETVMMYVERHFARQKPGIVPRNRLEQFGQRVWAVLVNVCGAYSDKDGIDEARFVTWFANRTFENGIEWRFGGKLGFGGKFWINSGRWYVNCYPEDKTVEMSAVMVEANSILDELRLEYEKGA